MAGQSQPLSNNAIMFNNALNTVGEAGKWVLDQSHGMIIPGTLGGIGGWLAGVGPGPGVVQGVFSGILYSYVLSPLGTHISRSPTEGDGSISYGARGFWYTAGVIA